jgi:hypothetical protein
VTNPSGRRWENEVIDFLRDVFPKMERRRLHGRFDKGEFHGTGPWAFECKNEKVIRWSDALREAEQEAANAGVPWHAAIIKRRAHIRHKAYVVMTLGQFRDLLRQIEELRDGIED